MAKNTYTSRDLVSDITEPPRHAFDITPDDDTDLTFVTRAIWVGTGGNLKVTLVGGETVTYKNLPDGTEKVGCFVRVFATGTTASDLVGEY